MIEIDQNTLISEIIKENKLAINEIAKINSNFEKLRNPVLQKLFVSNVSIKQAALIGGVQPNTILEKLSAIGFKVNYSE